MAVLKQRGEFLKLIEVSVGSTRPLAANSTPNRPETSSLPADDFFGRKEDKECVIKKLLACADDGSEGPESSKVADRRARVVVVPVVGMGGLGKTTFAQEVYNDESVQRHFSFKKWLFVGEHFDASSLIKDILGEARGARNLDDLHRHLISMLENQRFLLVLDDVWCHQRTEWEQLWRPLGHGDRGSKVLVTTRNLDVARAMGPAENIHQLPQLSDKDCCLIFQRHAFPDNDANQYPLLKKIGEDIVGKMKGLPLAAKVIGSLLSDTKDEGEWERILENEVWSSNKDGEDLIEQVVGLSYLLLPAVLKQCFAYCAMFPKDFRFDKTMLVQMWMAQGFIQPDEANNRMEDVGNNYFRQLLESSFFQCVQGEYVMHDIVHDHAQSISRAECWTMGEKKHKIPEKLCHLSFSCTRPESAELVGLSDKFPRLRSLVHTCTHDIISFHCFRDAQMFNTLPCIRVLDLKECSLRCMLLDSVGDLIHLRYLDLRTTGISGLPESTCKLYNLQTLKVDDDCSLPTRTSRLVNLRCLSAGSESIAEVPRIGRLNSLQELRTFRVQRISGHTIRELARMTQLRGRLCIQGLENVDGGKAEAATASIQEKRFLESLELKWAGDDDRDQVTHDAAVLEGLQPHPNVRRIMISRNMGARPPSWIQKGTISSLRSIQLLDCPHWSMLPPLGALPSLESLKIGGMKRMKTVGSEFYGDSSSNRDGPFPFLKELEFYDMPEWEEWSSPAEATGPSFPKLHALHMRRCPRLRKLPLFPPSVAVLTMEGMGFGFPLSTGTAGQPHRGRLTSLTSFLHCQSLALETLTIGDYAGDLAPILSQGGTSGYLAAIKSLTITRCSGLATWPDAASASLATLSSLELTRVTNLTSLPEAALSRLTALQHLSIKDCAQLVSVGFPALVSLKHLEVYDCPELAGCEEGSKLPSASTLEILRTDTRWLVRWLLPQRLASLTRLFIENCAQLVSFSHEEQDGLASLTSVTWVRFLRCPNLEAVPSGMRCLPALTYMEVVECPIARLPDEGLPTSLTSMYIHGSTNIIWLVTLGIEGEKYEHVQRIFWPQ